VFFNDGTRAEMTLCTHWQRLKRIFVEKLESEALITAAKPWTDIGTDSPDGSHLVRARWPACISEIWKLVNNHLVWMVDDVIFSEG
jgi:hypothetical protein